MSALRRALAWFGGAVATVALHAHDPGLSTVQGRVLTDTVEVTAAFAPADAQLLLPPAARTTSKWTQAEFVAAQPLLAELATQLWELRASGVALAPRETHTDLQPGDSLSFHVVFVRPAGAEKITLRATQLGALPPGHRQFAIISNTRGVTIAKKLLNAKDDALEVDLSATASAGAARDKADDSGAPTFWSFLKLGVEHIWTGYDHLLFLFALLVVCRTFKSIVAIITCFTLAHSTTLALATLNVVNLPSRFTEPAIAATIVFVGLENLFRRGAEPPGRWALTFGFGLIHGFGFASVLRELGVGEGGTSIVMPLFTFNAGVEVGQIAIAAIVLPIVWRLRKNEKFVMRGVPALSAVVAAAGLYWLVERTMF